MMVSTLRFREGALDLDTTDTFQFQLGEDKMQLSLRQFKSILELDDLWIRISFGGDFLGSAPSYTLIRELLRKLCYRWIAFTIYGKGHAPEKVTTTDHFFLRSMDEGTVLEIHFWVIIEQSLQTLTVKVHELPTINPEYLIRLRICERLLDTVAWVAEGPKMQQVGATGGDAQVDPEVPHDAHV
ncbi:hypothetical protein Tco_0723438, partial [Tanacetum coccineum]